MTIVGLQLTTAMWGTTTAWLDVAVFVFLILIGHILLGHFEDFKPKWRRVLKVLVSVALFSVALSALGRFWAWVIFITPVVIGGVIIHGWWLPKHGINGWTGEPREKYLELVGARSTARPSTSRMSRKIEAPLLIQSAEVDERRISAPEATRPDPR